MERGTRIVIELLAKGTTKSEIAELVGCSHSAVCQVEEAYCEAIGQRASEMRAAEAAPTSSEEMAESLDSRLDRMEHTLLDKIESAVPLETNLMKLSKVFQTVNGAKRRSKGEGLAAGAVVNNVNVVSLRLPEHINREHKFVRDSHGQIVEVDGQAFNTASEQLVNKMAGIDSAEESEHEESGKYLGKQTGKESS